jgi:hypothetical protein
MVKKTAKKNNSQSCNQSVNIEIGTQGQETVFDKVSV